MVNLLRAGGHRSPVCLFVFLAASTSAMAHGHGDTPYYFVLGYGANEQRDSYVFAEGYDKRDVRDFSSVGLLGLQVNRNLSAEIGAADFGEVEIFGAPRATGTALRRPVTLEDGSKLSHRSMGYMLGVRYAFQLTRGYTNLSNSYVYLRGGALQWHRQVKLAGAGRLDGEDVTISASYSEHDRDSYFGAGLYLLAYQEHASRTGVALDYTEYDLGGSVIPSYTLQLVFDF